MSLTSFRDLPGDARVWIFAAADPLSPEATARLLREVDDYLAQWKAHDEPLTCARDWRDGRFLAIGVDQSTAGASGCSIDALFRILQGLQASLGAALLSGARVFHRDAKGCVVSTDRAEFARRASSGTITSRTPVFDTTVVTAAAYRQAFERPMGESWHREIAGAAADVATSSAR